MSTGIVILLVILGALAGAVASFFVTRKLFTDQIKNNPRLDEDSLRIMMTQMGQRPSETKVRQTYQLMLKNQAAQDEKASKKSKKK